MRTAGGQHKGSAQWVATAEGGKQPLTRQDGERTAWESANGRAGVTADSELGRAARADTGRREMQAGQQKSWSNNAEGWEWAESTRRRGRTLVGR